MTIPQRVGRTWGRNETLPNSEKKGWRLERVALMAAFTVSMALAVGAWFLIEAGERLGALANDTAGRLVPHLQSEQAVLFAIEQLQHYGATVRESANEGARQEALAQLSRLVGDPVLATDADSLSLIRRGAAALNGLANARALEDADRSGGGKSALPVPGEGPAREEWRQVEQDLHRASEAIALSMNAAGTERGLDFERAADRLRVRLYAAGLSLVALLLLAGVAIRRWLLQPILLTTQALADSENELAVKLPHSRISEIDRFYRSVERIAASLADIGEAHRQERATQAELRRLASVDELTGIANRRWFSAMAGRELERCRRFNHPLALLMIDIDHFKQVNDTHGHAIGDEVLRAFTRVLESNLRSLDLLGRLGGEEFAVVLPEADQAAAEQTAERLRSAVEAMAIPLADGSHIRLTASVGIAMPAESATEPLDGMLARADTALYTAKHGGRNRVVVY